MTVATGQTFALLPSPWPRSSSDLNALKISLRESQLMTILMQERSVENMLSTFLILQLKERSLGATELSKSIELKVIGEVWWGAYWQGLKVKSEEIWEWSDSWPSEWPQISPQVLSSHQSPVCRPALLNCQSCCKEATRWMYYTGAIISQVKDTLWKSMGLLAGLSTKTGTSNLDQILISLNFQCDIYIPAGGLFHTNLHLTSSAIRSLHWTTIAHLYTWKRLFLWERIKITQLRWHKHLKRQLTSFPQNFKKN